MENEHYLRRIAIDQSGILGSFYNARIDRVLSNLPLVQTATVKAKSNEPTRCNVVRGNTYDHKSLLEIVGIDDNSWLCAILNTTPNNGILSLVNYSFRHSKSIRYLYYCHSSEEQSISYNQKIVRKLIPEEIPKIDATHIISVIKLGIQTIIILELII